MVDCRFNHPITYHPITKLSRYHAVHHPRERYRLAHMLEAADPSDDTLDAHAESGMRHRSEPPQIEIPLECLLRKVVILDTLQEHVVARQPLAAADDFADAFRRQHIYAQRELGPFGIRLHVKRL